MLPYTVEGGNGIHTAAWVGLRHHHHLPVVVFHIGELVLEVEPADDLFQSGCFACSAEYGECTQVVDAERVDSFILQQNGKYLVSFPVFPKCHAVRTDLDTLCHALTGDTQRLCTLLTVNGMPYRYLIAPGVAHVDKFAVTVHDVQSLVGQHDQRIRVIADEPDFNGGIYSRREFEQHGTGDGIGIVGLHVGIKILFLLLGIFAVRYFHQDIGEVRFGADGSGGQIVTQRCAAECDGYPFHFRLLHQMRFHLFHFGFYFADAVPVRIEYICPKVGLVQRREEVLGHQPHDDEGEDEQCCNASKGQRLLAYQCAEDGGEFMVERLVVWVLATIFSLCFQYEVAECSGLCQRQHPT